MAAKRRRRALILIHCGETTWARDGRVMGAADLPLSDTGRASTASDVDASVSTGAAMVYHPNDEAATETAAMYAEHIDARTKAVSELSDPRLGLLEGLTVHEFAERFPKRYKQWEADPLLLAPPDGEDLVASQSRLFLTVARLMRKARSEEVAIVLHTLGLGMMRCWLADRPTSDLWEMFDHRPRIERYEMAEEMIDWLEKSVLEQTAG